MTSSGPSPSTASSSSSAERWRRITVAAGLVLAAAGVAVNSLLEPAAVDRPPFRAAPPLTRKLLVIEMRGVPAAVAEWPELTPFYGDVRHRGRGGVLRSPLDPNGVAGGDVLVVHSASPGEVAESKDDDELTGHDHDALEMTRVFGRHESCALTLALDTASRAVERYGAALRTSTGSASRTALTIRALDQRCFEAARDAGSDAVVVLVHSLARGGRRYAAAGPGLAVERNDREMGGPLLADTLRAVLGLVGDGDPAEYLDGVEITAAERTAHQRVRERWREYDAAATDAWLRARLVSYASVIAAGIGLLLAIRAAWSMRAPASGCA